MVKLILGKGVDYVAAILVSVMTVLVFLQVLFRYWLHLPLDWGEEVSRYLFIWSAMLGAAIATKRKKRRRNSLAITGARLLASPPT